MFENLCLKFRRDEGKIRSHARKELKSKLGSGLKYIGQVFQKSMYHLLHIFEPDEEDPLYDCDAEDKGTWTPNRIATWVVNGVNVVYGLIGGFLTQNYLAYRSLKFMAFAKGVEFSKMTSRMYPTPLTICMDIVFFFCFYIALIVIQGLLYVGLKFLLQEKLYDPKEQCQVGFMYGILCIVISGLIGILVPFNVFM